MNKILVVAENISEKSAEKLKEMGYSLIFIPKNPIIEPEIACHPDMSIAVIKDKVFIDCPLAHLFDRELRIIKCDRQAENKIMLKYPDSIEFNCVEVGDRLICNKKYTNKTILKYAQNCGIEVIDVKQGYSKCSVCVVSDNAIITEDDSIEKACENAGIDVLKISKGYVELEGYDYGFIGGCSGLLEKNLLAFNGYIENHPNYNKITDFCSKHGVQAISLNDEKLCDVGSIIRIK